jgi:hypothetical protein
VILSDLGNFTYFLVDFASYGQTFISSRSRTLAEEVLADNPLPQVEPSRPSEYL